MSAFGLSISENIAEMWISPLQTLLGTVPVDNATFTLWLHQNLPQYCEDVDQMFAAMEDIGTSDMMKTDTDLVSAELQGILSDELALIDE